MTNILAYRLCREAPNTKTFIKKTVEYPESIYFEDNIYPGFDEKDRLLMIRNYLDGVHLRELAVNAPDGTIIIYSATADDWQTSNSKLQNNQKMTSEYLKITELEAMTIAGRAKIVSKEKMPKFKYKIVFNPVKLTDLEQKYLYSDEVIITDNQNDEVIAYNRRLMRFWYTIAPDIAVGNRYYYPYFAMCGDSEIYGFDEDVFIFYKDVPWQPAHLGINSYLYKISMEDNEHVK